MKQLSLLARARKIQETVTQHYEKECRAKCLRAVWKHHVEEEFGINYHTFLRYLHTDTSELEERLEQIDKEMVANATNAGKLRELSDEQQEIQQKLDEKMDRWVYLNDLAEQIENQKE